MNQLRQMSVFARIVEAGSISAAAEILDLSKSVVSQHLKSLEDHLGVTLLNRTTRRQKLTDAGHRFYLQCKKLNEIADEAWLEARDSTCVPQGKIRITAPNALMDVLVVPVIAEMMKQYPMLRPELISSDQQLNLTAEYIDLAIRVGTSPDSSMKQRRIGVFRDVLCCHSSVVNQEQSDKVPYIANQWQASKISHELTHKTLNTKTVLEREASCVTNSFHTLLAMLTQGAGMGIVPDFLFESEGCALVEVDPEYQLPVNPVYAISPFSSQPPLAVKLCLEALVTRLNQVSGSESLSSR